MATFDVQILEKDNITQQHFETLNADPQALLAPNSVRTQTVLIGLTANNVSYAAAGRFLKWWDTYPVPNADAAKAEKYGLVPGWGFARIIKSTVGELHEGQLLWGYWPFHNAPVDLQLARHDYTDAVPGFPGFWRETSPHRQGLMNLYNRYFVQDGSMERPKSELETMAWRANLAVWESGFLLAEFVFPSRARRAAGQQVHPSGMGKIWTAQEADLAQTAVVAFGGSSKTAMCFASCMRRRAHLDRAASLVGVASTLSIKQVDLSERWDQWIEYDSIEDPTQLLPFVNKLASSHKRIILMDLTSRGNALFTFYDAAVATGVEVKILKIGSGPQRTEDAGTSMSRLQQIGFWQANASAIRDDVTAKIGEATYAKEAEEAFQSTIAQGGLPGSTLRWGKGVRGPDGVEGGWNRLCSGKVGADESLVYTF